MIFKCDKCGHGNCIILDEDTDSMRTRCNSCLNITTTIFEVEE